MTLKLVTDRLAVETKNISYAKIYKPRHNNEESYYNLVVHFQRALDGKNSVTIGELTYDKAKDMMSTLGAVT